MTKFIKKNRRFIKIGVGYLIGFLLLSFCTFFYFYFRNPLVLTGIIVLVFVASYLMPTWFKLFLKAKPYKGLYKKQLMKFSEQAKISIREIYVRKSARSNAFAASYWNNKSIIFNSSVLKKHPFDEIEAVMAHELGHHINRDIYLYTSIFAIVLSFVSWASVTGNLIFQTNLWLSNFITSIILLPIILLVSRWREGLADSYAKRILGDPSTLARFFERLIDFERKDGVEISKDANFFSRIFLTHPWVYDRIRFLKE